MLTGAALSTLIALAASSPMLTDAALFTRLALAALSATPTDRLDTSKYTSVPEKCAYWLIRKRAVGVEVAQGIL